MNLKQRITSAFQSLFVADSLAMPVHWYYRISDIFQHFPGGIQKLEPAPQQHPGSIMSLHSTQHGGRHHRNSAKQKTIVGDVILKGRKHLWNESKIHYHHAMQAGDNTLNAYCVRVLLQCYISSGHHFDLRSYLQAYVDMMTADPPPHNDTYAESYHRGFFANQIQGMDITQCGARTHDTASIGGLVSIGPLTVLLKLQGLDNKHIKDLCLQFLHTTHPDAELRRICGHYVELTLHLLQCDTLEQCRDKVRKCAIKSIGIDFHTWKMNSIEDNMIVGGRYSSACYISDSWPSVLYLSYKYYDRPAKALLSNTHLGGDNVHRGSVIGFVLGLMTEKPDAQILGWFGQLINKDDITGELKMALQLK